MAALWDRFRSGAVRAWPVGSRRRGEGYDEGPRGGFKGRSRRYLDQRLRISFLRAVDAVDAHGSLLKVSAVLGVPQPALTKSLHELEDILQTRLLDRHSRGVRTTEAGLVFVRTARRILAELRRLDEELDQLSSPRSGSVALGALPVAAAGILPGTLTRLKATDPNIKARLHQGRTEDLLPLLASGEIDLIVGWLYAPAVPEGFAREALWTASISILARTEHPIFSEEVTVEALGHFDLVLPTVSQRVGQEIEHLLALLGLQPTTSLRSSSYGFIREMLHATDLIAVMPRPMMVGEAPSTWGGAWRRRSGRVGGRHDTRSQVTLRRLPLSR